MRSRTAHPRVHVPGPPEVLREGEQLCKRDGRSEVVRRGVILRHGTPLLSHLLAPRDERRSSQTTRGEGRSATESRRQVDRELVTGALDQRQASLEVLV